MSTDQLNVSFSEGKWTHSDVATPERPSGRWFISIVVPRTAFDGTELDPEIIGWSESWTPAECFANARLMTAGPEMFAVIKSLLECGQNGRTLSSILESAEIVYKKVTGEIP